MAITESTGELHTTISGLPLEPVYTPETTTIDYDRDLGTPGEYPFTRGVYPTMYRGRLWTMRQFAGFGTAEETNERFRYLLEHGQTGLSTAFDMPTLMGYDSDHPRSLGEVGREGVAIDSLDDMETLFAGIPLGEVSTSMTINSPAAMLLAFYVCVGEEQGVAARPAPRHGADRHPQGVHRAEGVHLPAGALDAARGGHDRVLLAGAAADAPGLHLRLPHPRGRARRPRRSSRSRWRTASPTWTRAASAVSTSTTSRPASRSSSTRTWTSSRRSRSTARHDASGRREMRERHGAKNPRSWLMRFHSQTAGVSLTAQQPEVNIVRTAIEALAAVLGGTQSLHTNSFDEALALPTEHAVRIALRTQQVIAHETGVVNTTDPLGGSWFIEDLTNRLEAEAYEYFDRIEKLGGVIEAIKENFFQREIADASFRFQSEVEAGDRVIVGVNRYRLEDEAPPEILSIDPALEGKQVARVQALRARRDSAAVEQRLAQLREAAGREDVNLMPVIIDCARDYVTMGEMCDALRDVWGIWRETPVF